MQRQWFQAELSITASFITSSLPVVWTQQCKKTLFENMLFPLERLTRTISLAGLSSIFLKTPCSLCGAPGVEGICLSCRQHIQHCRLEQPLETSTQGLSVLAWGSYRDALRQAIAKLKYQNQRHLARLLGSEIGRLWLQQAPKLQSISRDPKPIVVPIPLHSERLRQRGFNQAELLAYWACRVAGLQLAPHGLVRIRPTEAQYQLNAEARRRNLSGAFGLGATPMPVGSRVLLIDDIYTTGVTAQAAAEVLRAHGILVVGIGVAARAQPS